MSTCGIIAPRQEQVCGLPPEQFTAECFRENNHDGPHSFRIPSGEVYCWEYDMSCDCCEPDEDQRCTVFWLEEEAT